MTGPVYFSEYDKSFAIFQADASCEAPNSRREPIDHFVFCDPDSQTCARGSSIAPKSVFSSDYLALAPILLADLPAMAAAFQQDLPQLRAEELDLIRSIDANWDSMAGVALDERSPQRFQFEHIRRGFQIIENGSLSEMRLKYRDVPAFFQHAGFFYLQAAFCFEQYRDSAEAGRYIYAAHSHFRRGFEVVTSAMAQTIETGNYNTALQFAMLAREYLFEQLGGYEKYDIKNQWRAIKEDFEAVTTLFVDIKNACISIENARLHAIAMENIGDLYARKAEVAGLRAGAEVRGFIINEARDAAIDNYDKAAEFFKALSSTTSDTTTKRQLLAAEARQHLKSAQLLIERGDYEIAHLQALKAVHLSENYFRTRPMDQLLVGGGLPEVRIQDGPFSLAIAEGETLVVEALSGMRSTNKVASHAEKARDAIFRAVEARNYITGEAVFTNPDFLVLADLLERLARVNNPEHPEFQAATWVDIKVAKVRDQYADRWMTPYIAIDPRMTVVRSAIDAGTFTREHIEMLAEVLRSYEGLVFSSEQIIVRMAMRDSQMIDWFKIINVPESTIHRIVEFARVEMERIGRDDVERVRKEREKRELK